MRTAVILVAAGIVGPAFADCKAEWALMSETFIAGTGLTLAQPVEAVEADGWCRVEALEILTGGEYQPDVKIGSLEWRGTGVQGLFDGSVPPEALDLRFRDFRLGFKTPDPVMTYLIQAQAGHSNIDGDLAATWDPAKRRLEVTRADLDFPGDNAIRMTASVSNVDLSSLGAMQMSLTGFAVNRLRFEVQSNGLFEGYFLMPIGALLLEGAEDPADEAAAMKEEFDELLADLPEAAFPAQTKAAFAAVAAEMPNPAGTLTVEVASDAGFGPAQLTKYVLYGLPTSVAEIDHILSEMQVAADYVPAPAEEE